MSVNRISRRATTVAVAASAIALGVCAMIASPAGARPGQTKVGPPPGYNITINPLDDPASPHRIVYAAGLVSDPLPANPPVVNITAEQALAWTQTQDGNFGPQLQEGSPTATLRMVASFADQDADPVPLEKPAWVLVWQVIHPVSHGKAASTNVQPEPAVTGKCVFVVVVDSETGIGYDARQVCVRDPQA